MALPSGRPRRHRPESLSAAVQPLAHPDEFRRRYEALLKHYGVAAEHVERGEA